MFYRYEVLQCGDIERLIRRRTTPDEPPVYYAYIENMYDIIHRAHIATGHGGRDRMLKHLGPKYANITRDTIELFKSYCKPCQEKVKRPKTTGVVVRPIISHDFNSRSQVDLIDMQASPQSQYKWIMVYQCHLTKYCVLRPLTSKRAAEVAYQLLDIFLMFGAPCILQSDNGSEFTAQVIQELRSMYPQLKMVHGKPRHPQSQRAVERANSDIKDMLAAWLSDNNTQDWSLGLRFVANQKNSAYHSGIKSTPYAALFGSEPKVGLTSSALPSEVIEHLETEDDLLAVLQATPSTTQTAATSDAPTPSTSDAPTPSTTPTSAPPTTPTSAAPPAAAPIQPTSATTPPTSPMPRSPMPTSPMPTSPMPTSPPPPQQSTPALSQPPSASLSTSTNPQTAPIFVTVDVHAQPPSLASSAAEPFQHHDQPPPLSPAPHLLVASRKHQIGQKRRLANEAQMAQAERMVKRSRIDLQPGQPGDNVAVPIPSVDRGRGDPRNILGVITDRNENDLYTIAVRSGILKSKYTRNEFTLCPQRLLHLEDMNQEATVSLRQAMKSSASGGQGFVKCNCASTGSKKCSSNRCLCIKSKVLCNSRCHNSLNCRNK